MPLHAAQGLSLIRIAFGLYFVVSAFRKTTTGWLSSSDPLSSYVGRSLEGATPAYGDFLATTVLPNADRFAQLVVLGEWVTGISLLAGLLTRMGSLVGMWLMLNYMLDKGLPTYDGSQDRLFVASCAVFAVTAAGLVWGLDGALRPHLESNPITRWLAGLPARAHVVPTRTALPYRRLASVRRRRVA